MTTPTTVIYHPDADGFGAALAVWLTRVRGEEEFNFVAASYGAKTSVCLASDPTKMG